jgi:Ca-activated chloride channel family protein
MRCLTTFVLTLILAAPLHAAGLLAPSDQTLPPLRVTDHLVDAAIHDGIAVTTVTQTFRNDTDRRLEATYVFPLPEEADLTDFQMTFNGKMVKGRVLPKDEARQIYESIVRQSKDPGLIEFIGRRLLQMRVFPIEPRSDTTIQVRYQQVCRPVSGMTAFHYPLRTRTAAGQAYGTVRFAVSLETGTPLKNIWSPTHAVEIVRGDDERTARIAYEASGGSLDDDFLLLYGTDSSDLGLSVVAYRPDEKAPGHFVLMLTPKQLWPEEQYQPQDVVFIIDTSGSMAGDKLKQAKGALKYCIESLDERDRFSVVRFSTGFDTLFESVQPATKESRAKARDWIDGFTAAGGTNIADTLGHVLAMRPPSREARPFVAVFLTDGRGNREADEIMSALAVKNGDASVRIFPFGVGHDVNTKLLDRLADTYTGHTTYVQPGEQLELVLGDFFSVISRPVLTSLKLTLPEIGATERFPASLGDLYHGQQIILAGRFTDTRTGPVKLTALRNGRAVEYVWPDVAFTHDASADAVPSVWAGRKIAYLIDQIRTHGESDEMLAEVLALSQEYGIQTPYTSWLVDPERQPQLAGLRRGVQARGRFGGGGAPGLGAPAPTAGRAAQERALRDAASRAAPGSGPGVGAGGSIFGEPGADTIIVGQKYGDEFGDIDLHLAEGAVAEESGAAANLIARKNAELKQARSRDEGRLDTSALLAQKIGGRWYNRIGRLLVDEQFAEDTAVIAVRFASEAYFELVDARPALRPALAASSSIVVLLGDGKAVLVSDRVGIVEFSDEDRKQIGLD